MIKQRDIKMKTYAFAGHRPQNLPWRFNETDRNCLKLKEILTTQIMQIAEAGVTDFLSGVALDVDYEKRKVMRSEILDAV